MENTMEVKNPHKSKRLSSKDNESDECVCNTVNIVPNLDCIKKVAECQCELGREKLLTAPPYKRLSCQDHHRYATAPCAREAEHYHCPVSQILVTFHSPLQPKELCHKIFPSDTLIKNVKRKLAKLLGINHNNILLTKNRAVLKDATTLAEIKPDAVGNTVLDVFTKDGEEFFLSDIPKESYVHDLLHSMLPTKKNVPFIAIKFKVRNQNETFTRSYNSCIKIHEIKKNLGELLDCNPTNLVLLRGENPLLDRMTLLSIDYDKYYAVEVELLTKNKQKLHLEKLYKEGPFNDVLSVSVPMGAALKFINVEIFSQPIRKPYLGGYRNIHTGTEYHHAYTQTPQRAEKVASEFKNNRDTQTGEEKVKAFVTPYSRATQMAGSNIYIPNVTDRIVEPKPYETYEEMVIRLNHEHYAIVIQRAFRHYQFRQKVRRWLNDCLERIRRMNEEDRLEREAMERRLRKDLVTKTFPKTREDFDQLYAMVDRWKQAEIARISQLHAKGPKIAEFTLLLDKEVELLRCIEAYRVQVREDGRKLRDQKFLDEISKPIAWYGRSGKLITMETVEIQRARKLRELYNSFIRTDMDVKDRMELLVDMKFALQEFRHNLAEETIALLDRECDLLVRRCTSDQLDFLRRRVAASIFQILKTSELNCDITKVKDMRDYRKMKGDKLFFCEMCHQVKIYTDFPLNAKMNPNFITCKSCTWKDAKERLWTDMTPFKFILRAVQREERRKKCWGSLAFVLQEKDIFFIVEKLWHSHSAISECNDITELRMCRWHVNEDWSPWNCFLVTVQEMKAHLKLDHPEDVYDEELVRKVKNKQQQARASFRQLTLVDKRFTESGDWHTIRAPAVLRANAVEPL